ISSRVIAAERAALPSAIAAAVLALAIAAAAASLATAADPAAAAAVTCAAASASGSASTWTTCVTGSSAISAPCVPQCRDHFAQPLHFHGQQRHLQRDVLRLHRFAVVQERRARRQSSHRDFH